MVSGDFCRHDWPGSGCRECRKEETPTPTIESDLELIKTRLSPTDIEGIAIIDAVLIQVEKWREMEFRLEQLEK